MILFSEFLFVLLNIIVFRTFQVFYQSIKMKKNSELYKNQLQEKYQKTVKKEARLQEEYLNPLPKKEKIRQEINYNIGNKYRQEIVVLDSEDRDKTKYPFINEFVLTLAETIKDVLIIRVLRSEYTEKTTGSLVINGVLLPITTVATFSAYINLNNYKKIKVANNTISSFFCQLIPGVTNTPAATSNFFYDPYAVIMNPIEKSLNKFHVKLCNSTGNLLPSDEADTTRLILTLCVYTM
jgi:hypothetical protein